MAISITLQQYLVDHQIPYSTLEHNPTLSSSRTASAAHVPGGRLIKAIVVKSAGKYVVALLPASHHLRLNMLEDVLLEKVELATEDEFYPLFADCSQGAIPALGMAFGLELIVDEGLVSEGEVLFEGGDHSTLVRMQASVFENLMSNSTHEHISRHD